MPEARQQIKAEQKQNNTRAEARSRLITPTGHQRLDGCPVRQEPEEGNSPCTCHCACCHRAVSAAKRGLIRAWGRIVRNGAWRFSWGDLGDYFVTEGSRRQVKNQRFRIALTTVDAILKGECDVSLPFMLPAEEMDSVCKELFEGDGPTLKSELADAMRIFSASEERKHPLKGRGKLDIASADLANDISQRLGNLMQCYKPINPKADSGVEGENRLARLCKPDWYFMAGRRMQVSSESASVGAFRWTLVGTRQVYMWPFTQAGNYVRNQTGSRALRHPINTAATFQWLKSATATTLEDMLNSGHCDGFRFSATGPRDLIYLPCGWIKAELPAQDDAAMVRMTIVPTAAAASAMSEVNAATADYLLVNKRNLALDFAAEKLKEAIVQAIHI